MLRSHTIQRDKIPRKIRSFNNVQTRDITATSITGLSNTGNIISRAIVTGNPNIEQVHIDNWSPKTHPKDRPIYIWGLLRGGHYVLEYCKENGVDYFFCDNGYFKTSPKSYRITKNEMQLTVLGTQRMSKLREVCPSIHEWRKDDPNKSILICPPSKTVRLYKKLDNWLEDTIKTLRTVTTRNIEVRNKPTKLDFFRREDGFFDTMPITQEKEIEPLGDVLARTHSIVTYNSTVFVDALITGVPVFCDASCSASVLGNTNLENIESPIMDDMVRRQLLCTLANNQWTLTELERGRPWKVL